jgi:hypothetical protein
VALHPALLFVACLDSDNPVKDDDLVTFP